MLLIKNMSYGYGPAMSFFSLVICNILICFAKAESLPRVLCRSPVRNECRHREAHLEKATDCEKPGLGLWGNEEWWLGNPLNRHPDEKVSFVFLKVNLQSLIIVMLL